MAEQTDFEKALRARIAGYQFNAPERVILKVVLGDLQQKSGKVTDATGHSIVKGMIEANKVNLGYLAESDSRRNKYLLENEVLTSLLPSYWSADQIKEALQNAGIDVKTMPEGQATGKAIAHLKSLNAPHEGQTVKAVVVEMRSSS